MFERGTQAVNRQIIFKDRTMVGKTLLASAAASAFVLASFAATPTLASAQSANASAQSSNSRIKPTKAKIRKKAKLNLDTELWVFGAFVISQAIIVGILASEKKPGGNPTPTPTPVSP